MNFSGSPRRRSPLLTRPPSRLRIIPPAVRLVIGLAVLVILGTGLLLLPGMGATRPLTLREALFTATSALSVTGLSVIAPGRDLTVMGQLALLVLMQIGGVGFMVLAVGAFSLIGRKIPLVDRLALRDSLGLLAPRAILRLTQRVVTTVLTIELLGALALWLHWRQSMDEGRAVFFALFHAVAAFCNAGFDLFGGLPAYPAGLPNDGMTLLIFGVLIVLGGLGIPVLADGFTWFWDRQISLHTRLTVIVVACLILGGTLGLWLAEGRHGILAGETWPRQLGLALFQSVSARTAGFMGVASFEALQPASQLLLIVLMFIGSGPASMGGGITTGTFAVLLLALWGYARNQPAPHIGGRRVGEATVRRAGAVLTISLFIVLVATWLILLTHPTTLDAALFEVVSAFATTGLSLAFTGDLNPFGQAIIILVMFWGRLGALTVIIALAQQAPPQRVTYPEEQVLIG